MTSSTDPATFAALDLSATIQSVAVTSGKPVVTFKLTSGGLPVIGFGQQATCFPRGGSASNPYVIPCYPNVAFSIAKLLPATQTVPSKWVSYMVTSVPTKSGATATAAPSSPTTDNTGTLVDNKDGTYTYTFYRDISAIKAQVDGMTVTAPNDKADLGDLSYDPTLTHRLTIQISGSAPGTGTNTASGVQVTPSVPMQKPVDLVYDFIPATGAAAPASASRLITTTQNCNNCHSTLGGLPALPDEAQAGFHGGSRNKVEYCVVCHTEQRKYGTTEAAFNAATWTFTSTDTRRVDGRAVGNLPNMIHKVHLGGLLTKQAYNYAGVVFNEVTYPQDNRNCQNCHTAANPATPQGDNWKAMPSRLACGACHDGVNFDTGQGKTITGATTGPFTGGNIHPVPAPDGTCSNQGCHGVVNGVSPIDVAHTPVTPPNPGNSLLLGGTNPNTNSAWIASGGSVGRLPAGAIKVTYEINSVSRDATTKAPVMVFRLLQNGVVTALNNPATATVNPATGRVEIWDNFMGAPSVYFVWAVPQDNVQKPGDFNVSASSWLRNIWVQPGQTGSAGTLTGPDASGWYTAKLNQYQVPDNATMLTGGLGYTYNVTTTLPLTQTNLQTAYPTAVPTNPTYAGTFQRTGGLIVIAPNVQKVASGYTGRRTIVADAKCNSCHQELGTFTEDAFHAGQRNDGTTCSWCHKPNQTSSGWSADSVAFVHAIHGGKKRTVPYTWHASSTTETFADITYPGVLSNCEQCHVPGSYDFANAANADAAGLGADGLEKRLPRTVGQGFYPTNGTSLPGFKLDATNTSCIAGNPVVGTALSEFSLSPYVTKSTTTTPVNYGQGFSYNPSATATSFFCKPDGTFVSVAPGATFAAEGSTLISSPTVAACTGCHDSALAISHMEANGGSFYDPRSPALAKTEQCMVCHSTGRIADTKAVHVDRSR